MLFNAATNINKRKDPVPEVGLLSPPTKLNLISTLDSINC